MYTSHRMDPFTRFLKRKGASRSVANWGDIFDPLAAPRPSTYGICRELFPPARKMPPLWFSENRWSTAYPN